MAKIEFTAFIEDVLSSQSGAFGLKTSEPHRRKNDAGEYETTARTFRTVKASRESGVDFGVFVKGQRVQIWGTEKTEVREYQGKKLYDLVCWCDRIEPVESGANTAGAPAVANVNPGESWPVTELGAQNAADDPWPTVDPYQGATPW